MEDIEPKLRGKLGWLIIIIVPLIPVVHWFMLPHVSVFVNVWEILPAIAKTAAITGFSLYALALVLSTRLRIFESLFGGLNKVYIAHQTIGGIAFILLMIHPLFRALYFFTNSPRAAALLLLPHLSRQLNSYEWSINYALMAVVLMILLVVFTYFIKLKYQIWRFTHQFLGAVFFLGTMHVLFLPVYDWFIRVYLLVLGTIGLLAYAYHTLLGKILVRRYNYVVDEVKQLSDTVVEIDMHPVNKTMRYKPGQFIFVSFHHGGVSTEAHPFSISSSPSQPRLAITVKNLGDFTGTLSKLKRGASAEIEGAFGQFSYQNSHSLQQIWVAGGIGITPFLSMAQSLSKTDQHKIDLFYCVKSANELVDMDKLTEMVPLSANHFNPVAYVSDDMGFITAKYIADHSGGVEQKEIFICGPPMMMKLLRQQFRALGVPDENIHSEEFSMQ